MLDVIKEIQKKRHSAVVVLEDAGPFWLTWTQLQERDGFEVGQEVDAEELRQWLLPRQYPMALNDAVALLAQRAYASGEIEQKLKRKLYMDDTIEMVLYKLQKERLMDDAAFARDWAASRARCGIGRSRIVQELRMKGIPAEMIQQTLDELDEEEGEEAAVTLARKLLKRYAGETDERKAMHKLLSAMARRGYGYEESKRAVETAIEEMDA